MSRGKRPLRVWFTSYWNPDMKPEHCVKAVVRYDILSPAGKAIHSLMQLAVLLLRLERERKL